MFPTVDEIRDTKVWSQLRKLSWKNRGKRFFAWPHARQEEFGVHCESLGFPRVVEWLVALFARRHHDTATFQLLELVRNDLLAWALMSPHVLNAFMVPSKYHLPLTPEGRWRYPRRIREIPPRSDRSARMAAWRAAQFRSVSFRHAQVRHALEHIARDWLQGVHARKSMEYKAMQKVGIIPELDYSHDDDFVEVGDYQLDAR